MKKTLALVLTVVMIMGLALSGSAATTLAKDTVLFDLFVNEKVVATNTNMSEVNLSDLKSGDVLLFTNFQLPGGYTNFKLGASKDSGGGYMNIEVNNDLTVPRVSVAVKNETTETATLKFKIAVIDKAGTPTFNKVESTFTAKVGSSEKKGSGFDQYTAKLALDANKEVTIEAGDGAGKFGYITQGAFNTALSQGSSGSSYTAQGSDYKFVFKKGDTGTVSDDVDINGSRDVNAKFLSANGELKKDKSVVGIKDIKPNGSVSGTLELTGLNQDAHEIFKAASGLYVYNYETGKIASGVTAKYDADNRKVVLTGKVVGSFMVAVDGNLKAVDGGSSGKPNPGTGK